MPLYDETKWVDQTSDTATTETATATAPETTTDTATTTETTTNTTSTYYLKPDSDGSYCTY